MLTSKCWCRGCQSPRCASGQTQILARAGCGQEWGGISPALCKTRPAAQLAPACPALQTSPGGEGWPSHDRQAGCTTALGLADLGDLRGSASSPSDPPQDQGLERAPAAVLAAHIRGAFQRPTGNLPQGGGCKKAGGGGGAGRRASFDAPHKPLSVQQGMHWWAYKQGDKRCLQRLKAPNPLSWLAREPFQHSSPMGRPLHRAGRRAPGSVSRRPCPSSQPGPPGADIGPSALCILFHRFSHNLDKAAYSSPKAAIINCPKGGICEGSSHSFPVASLGALRGSPPVWLAEV